MPITVETSVVKLSDIDADLLVVGAFSAEGDDRSAPPELAADAIAAQTALGIDLAAELSAVGFDASVGSIARIPTRGALGVTLVVVVGLGRRDTADLARLRRAGAVAAGAASRVARIATGLHTALPDVDVTAAARALTEGVLLGGYRFTSYRSDPTPFELTSVALLTDDGDGEVAAGIELGRISADATMLARDLVNTPPQDKRPPALADRVVEVLAGTGIEVRILDEHALADGGYGGILGVGQGSSAPPRLVELTYTPDGAHDGHVVLVGKGITFDTGGISLKPSSAMETMKVDMAGAATVLAVVRAAAELALPVKLTGLLALAENMPSGTATRVSDVLTMKGGTTVEVINTDAEGRLVLGDALVHASELAPDAIVDVATLTGAATVALGEEIGVLMASDDDLANALLDASASAGEALWRLPLATEQYGDRLKGTIADLRNSGSRSAGTIFAGLFLHRFVGEGIPWAHLDIAGVAWSDTAGALSPKGATGVPVRTLLDWLAAR